jgi:uncharacterized membrane protein
MATRQTASKSGKRGTTSTARKPATGRPTSTAKSSGGTPAARASSVPAGKNAPVAPNPQGWRAVLRWAGGGVPFTTLIVSVLGLADAAYLTYEHFTQSASFACPENAAVNCVKVTTSPESHVFGIPVAVLGLAFFLFMVAINSPWGWRAPRPAVHWARLGSVVVGIIFVLYLIWAELFKINAICLYCTGVHVLTFILFALIVGRAAFSGVRAISVTD